MIHFYCFSNIKKIIVSDFKVEDIRRIFGYKYEVVNSVKEKESVEIVKSKLLKFYPTYIIEDHFKKIKTPITDAGRKKISDSKIGLKRDAATRAKISASKKGKSNFQGKKHNNETKQIMAEKKLGNQHAKNLVWAHDPSSDKEIRVKDRGKIPVGYMKGRDYYIMENFIYSGKKHKSIY